ncbi:MAG: hypothetical protein AAF478_13070 [Pseudomonadota bacterium]
MIEPDRFYEELGQRRQNEIWKQYADQAKWNVPSGRIGELVLQLRQRGSEAQFRATIMFAALLIVIGFGLIFFVVRPLLQDFADGRRVTFQGQISEANSEHNILDTDRRNLQKRLGNSLQSVLVPLDLKDTPLKAEASVDFNPLGSFFFDSKNDTILTLNEKGEVLRSNSNHDGWEIEKLEEPIKRIGFSTQHSATYAFSTNGMWRSENGGADWQPIPNVSGLTGILSILSDNPYDLFFSDFKNSPDIILSDPVSKSMFFSDNAGKTWEKLNVSSEPEVFGLGDFVRSTKSGDVLAVNERSGIYRFIRQSRTWKRVLPDSEAEPSVTRIYPLENEGEFVVLKSTKASNSSRNMTALHSKDDGETWQETSLNLQNFRIEKFLVNSENKFVGIFFSDGSAMKWNSVEADWREVEFGEYDGVNDLQFVKIRSANFNEFTDFAIATTNSGHVISSPELGLEWRISENVHEQALGKIFTVPGLELILMQDAESQIVIYDFGGNRILDTVGKSRIDISQLHVHRGTLIAVPIVGKISVSKDNGFSWQRVIQPLTVSGSPPRYLDLQNSNLPKFMASTLDATTGRFHKLSGELGEEIKTVANTARTEGDRILLEAFNKLDTFIKNDEALAFFNSEFSAIERKRTSANEKLETAAKNLKGLNDSEYDVGQKITSFEKFMAICSKSAADDQSTKASCVNAFKEILPKDEKDWWTILAEQVPFGVLLLFLLATLATLYRYNLRLASFYNSRADALLLLCENLKHDTLERFSDILAADKLEFAKSKTPSDQAVEIAKTIISKRP